MSNTDHRPSVCSSELALEPSLVFTAHQPPASEPVTSQNKREAGTYPALTATDSDLSADGDMWPAVKGLPFQIFTERIEDQLSAGAEAASPLYYEDDDKENDAINPELMPRPNPLDGISIIPASHYRRAPGPYTISGHSSIASNALYAHPQFEASPYGLGWNDGAHDMHISAVKDCPIPDYVHILLSGEHLPRASTSAGDCHSHVDRSVDYSSPTRSLRGIDSLH